MLLMIISTLRTKMSIFIVQCDNPNGNIAHDTRAKIFIAHIMYVSRGSVAISNQMLRKSLGLVTIITYVRGGTFDF